MAFCGTSKDVDKACDSVPLNLNASLLGVRLEALSVTRDIANPYLITAVEVIDPATGLYPLPASAYYPVKLEWLYNSVNPNYEVTEGTSVADSYIQTVGPLVISDSETAVGKANVKALNSNLWALVGPVKGAVANNSAFHIYGVTNGLKFLPVPTAVEFGNRVAGNFTSIAGGEEATPNGVNWLATAGYAATLAQFNDRLDIVT
jgi:hypothetical protein